MAVGLREMDGIDAARDVMQSMPLPIVRLSSHYDTLIESQQEGRCDGLSSPDSPIRCVQAMRSSYREFPSLCRPSATSVVTAERLESRQA